MVELYLDRLQPGRSALELADTLSLDEELGGGASVRIDGELDVDAMDQKVLVHGSFNARTALECHRCARSFERDYEAEIEIMILRNPVRAGDPEADEDDSWVIHQQGGVVVLDAQLVEAVMLHRPQRILCREDCRGLCPRCGADRNETECECGPEPVDPRWEALRRLKDEPPGER